MSDGVRILLDGRDEEELQPLAPGRRTLGRDPFDEPEVADPFLTRLEDFGGVASPEPEKPDAAPPVAPTSTSSTSASPASSTSRARPRAVSARRTGGTAIPCLAEVEPRDPQGLVDRLLDEDARRRLAALEHLAETAGRYDRYGLSPGSLRQAFPLFHALYRAWFRVKSEGHEHLPQRGGAVLVGNHGGLLPFDGAMAVMDVLLHTDPPRLPRAVVDRWAGRLPWVNVFFARVGQVVGTRENFDDLLDDDQLVLVFPEGMEGIRKPIAQRYRLQRFRTGFVERALRAGVPIVPMAIVGNDDQAPILYDVKPLAKALGLPVAPITPTFPWLGPLGLLPYPVSYRITYGEPLAYHERFGPEGAEDARLVRYLANQVRRAVQQLLDRSRG